MNKQGKLFSGAIRQMVEKKAGPPGAKQITLSQAVQREAEEFVAHSSQFDSLDEFINFVMAQILDIDGDSRTNIENEQITQRLRDLGYL